MIFTISLVDYIESIRPYIFAHMYIAEDHLQVCVFTLFLSHTYQPIYKYMENDTK